MATLRHDAVPVRRGAVRLGAELGASLTSDRHMAASLSGLAPRTGGLAGERRGPDRRLRCGGQLAVSQRPVGALGGSTHGHGCRSGYGSCGQLRRLAPKGDPGVRLLPGSSPPGHATAQECHSQVGSAAGARTQNVQEEGMEFRPRRACAPTRTAFLVTPPSPTSRHAVTPLSTRPARARAAPATSCAVAGRPMSP